MTPGARVRFGLAVAGATLMAVPLAMPSVARAVTVHDIFREPRIEGTRPQQEVLSPDERWVAFAWNTDGRTTPLDLYLAPVAGGAARALTHFPKAASAAPDSVRGGARDGLIERLPEYFKDPNKPQRVDAIAWSPNSKRLAFVKSGDLYVVGLDGAAPERLTRTLASESEPRWSPDGRRLAFVRDGALWLIQLARFQEVQLTPAGGDSASPSSLQWSPDGRRLAYATRDERGLVDLLVPNYLGPRVEASRVKEGLADTGVRVVEVDVASRARRPSTDAALAKDEPPRVLSMRLGAGRHPNVSAFAWSPDGERLAVTEVLADMRTRKLHVARADSGLVRTLYTEADSAWIEEFDWVIVDQPTLEWSPDGKSIFILSERTGFNHLLRVPVAGGAPVQLTEGPWEVGWAHVLPDGRRALVMDNRAASSQRQFELLDLGTRKLEPLGTAAGMNTHPAMVTRGGTVLYRHSRFTAPMELWAIEPRRGARPVQLSRTVPDRFHEVRWVVPEFVRFPARDGTPLHGLLYKPSPFEAGRRYPVIVFVHGAGSLQNVVDGWTIYSPNFKFHTLLAQKGYVVFEVDYRGSLGYGRDFRTGVHMHLGGKDLDDELAGVDWLKGQDFVDGSRIGIYGGSYGGFMALMALFQAPRTYACGAALRFVADWANYHRGNPGYCEQRLGTPEKNPTAYYRSSPIHFAEGLQAPLLLLHGVRDDNVHFQDAAQLTERLIRLGKKFDLMIYPRESHGFIAAESWIDEYRRIEDFFDQHLKASVAPQTGTGSGTSASPRQ